MKYLREFTNHAAYEAFTGTSEFVLPNVSLCDQENELHFNPNSGPTPGGDYVEIGGVKWATMNIGATSPSEVGLYFQWGDTSGYTASQVGTDKMFNWAIYKYCSGAGTSSSAMTKYNSTDGKTVLEASDDAAQANVQVKLMLTVLCFMVVPNRGMNITLVCLVCQFVQSWMYNATSDIYDKGVIKRLLLFLCSQKTYPNLRPLTNKSN